LKKKRNIIISKIGALNFTNEQRVADIESEFFRDILADFDEDNQNLLGELSYDEGEWIVERVKAEIKKVITFVKAI